MRILIIEDEPRMVELLRQGLYENGYTVMTAADGVTGLEIATTYPFDAVVLDIGLPRMDGYTVMQTLRARSYSTPVLMLTARDSEDEMIRGFDLGADDYLTKPFSFAELVARLQSITRPFRKSNDRVSLLGDLAVDFSRHAVTRQQQSIELSRLEFLLLACLVRHAGQCVSRQMLTEAVWGSEYSVSKNSLDVLVNSLRAKIDTPFPAHIINTVRGTGYLLRQNVITNREE